MKTEEVFCTDGSMSISKLVDQFQTLFNKSYSIQFSCIPQNYDQVLYADFSFDEVQTALGMVKDKKAAGED